MTSSALLALGHIPHDHAKLMTDAQIISLFQWDHYPIPHAHDGPTVGWNLVPRFIGEHREKTRKIDIPMIAKTKRVDKKWQAFLAKMAQKNKDTELPPLEIGRKKKWPSRPFQRKKK